MQRMVDAERRCADEREALLDTISDLSTELELSRLLDSCCRAPSRCSAPPAAKRRHTTDQR